MIGDSATENRAKPPSGVGSDTTWPSPGGRRPGAGSIGTEPRPAINAAWFKASAWNRSGRMKDRTPGERDGGISDSIAHGAAAAPVSPTPCAPTTGGEPPSDASITNARTRRRFMPNLLLTGTDDLDRRHR